MKLKTSVTLLTLALCGAFAAPVFARQQPAPYVRLPRGDGNPIPQPPTQFSWIHAIEELSPAALTVRAQTVSPNDDGKLVWDIFMPRQDVESTKISDLTPADFRVASTRRGWNRRGRRIPLITPNKRDIKIEPIESNFRLDEEEMNDVIARFLGNEELVRQYIGASIPTRTETLATANYRRLNVDTLQAWHSGLVKVKNPENDHSYDIEFDFAAERMIEAGTAWNASGVNAYDEFVAWLISAQDMIGAVRGVALRIPTRSAILASAPGLAGGARMSLANLEDRVQQDTGSEFRFFLMEQTVDEFVDGGLKTTRVKQWPAGKIAAIPADNRVGNVAFAPVARAMMLNNALPQAKIDVRGNSVFTIEENGGREMDVECQINALPVPDENRIAVIDTGIAV